MKHCDKTVVRFAGTSLAYTANALNQYSIVTETEAFTPTYDADGNATSVKTATGTWSISYNGENRPVRFENAGTQTVVECGYDSLGRRFEKKVTVAGTLVLHERYAYRGYLQIAAFDVAGTQTPTLKRVIYWDPTEETATRPFAVNILGDNVYFPTVDLTKNVCELVDFYGNVAATYDYAPFGAVSAASPSGSAVPANPLQWSSEIYDSELDLVYYNYRHYSPSLGRFLSRDPIEEQGGLNLYAFVGNQIWSKIDYLGRDIWVENTEAVFGLHQRVCVDQWVKSFRVDCEKTCCHNGIPYVRAGKFCISFGAKNPSDFAYISGDSGGLPPSSPNANNDCGLPPDFGPVVPGGTGVVYPDMDDKKEAESHRHSTGCGRDISSQKYMERLIGLESEYILFRRNCRTFSQAVLEHLVSMGEKYA